MADAPAPPPPPVVLLPTSAPRKRQGQVWRNALKEGLKKGLKMTTTTASNNRQTVFEVGAERIRTRRRGQFPARR